MIRKERKKRPTGGIQCERMQMESNGGYVHLRLLEAPTGTTRIGWASNCLSTTYRSPANDPESYRHADEKAHFNEDVSCRISPLVNRWVRFCLNGKSLANVIIASPRTTGSYTTKLLDASSVNSLRKAMV